MTGTYVYCLVAAVRRPKPARMLKGLTGTGPVRLLPVESDDGTRLRQKKSPRSSSALRRWLVVADAPFEQYGEGPVNRGLADLDWVSRAAVAHERVVESFGAAAAILPMKLFTIFASDEGALDDLDRRRDRIGALLNRVVNHEEWGVRLMFDRGRPAAGRSRAPARPRPMTGTSYLTRKKARRDDAAELATRAGEVVADVYDELAEQATAGRRRSAGELPIKSGPILLDAAFLVPRPRASRFRALVARRARALAPLGYRLSLTGPWPPYSFMQD